MFFINLGLTYNEIITKYSVVYYLLMVPFIYVQIKTIVLFLDYTKNFHYNNLVNILYINKYYLCKIDNFLIIN